MGVNIFGMDMTGAFDAIKGATSDLFQHLDAGDAGAQFQRLQGTQGDPFGQLGGGRDPFQGLRYGDDPFGKLGGTSDPFGGLNYGGGGGGPFGAFEAVSQRVRDRARQAAAAAAAGQPQTTGSTVGGGYTGSGTASDNQGLTAEKIDQFVASKFKNSPLAGQGAYILQVANRYGIAVPVLLGIAWKESGMGTNVGAGNIFGITDPSRDGGLGGQRAFQSFGGVQAEIEAAARLLGSDTYRGKSVADQVGTWYVGKPGDLNATDLAGNGTVGDYLNNFIAPAYAGLGAAYNQSGAPTRGGTYQGVGGLPSLTGGIGSIGQEFGDTDFSAGNPIYDYGAGSGVHGHTGIDWAVPPGTQVYMPAGLSGTVITSGGTAYFRDEDENPAAVSPAGQGELKIRLSNGMELILGHMRNISVPVGTQLTAGMLVGLAGSANGGHIHVELRQADPSLPNGYRILDPRVLLGGGGGVNPGGNR